MPALRLRQLIERVSLNVPTPMRAPVEGPGLWALESAMNELADAAGLDPLDVRLANFAEVSPADGWPWSADGLREAYEEGARRYGWRTRHQRPHRDGPWVIGHGMATCTMGSFRFPGAGRVRCAATAPWSRPTCTTSGPACRPCWPRSPPRNSVFRRAGRDALG